jgi:hypothetical protein
MINDDDDRSNADRAADAERAIAANMDGLQRDEDPHDDCVDLLTNLLHYMHQNDIDRGKVLDMAAIHFHAELKEERNEPTR